MYALLHDVAEEASFFCECRQPHPHQADTIPGERFHIDFFWYPKDAGRWARPSVVIEHENFEYEAEYDLWKVCQFAAPLRVFIGYARDEAAVPEMWKRLRVMLSENRLARISDSETLVMLGDYDKCVAFHAWVAGGDSEFRELPLVRSKA